MLDHQLAHGTTPADWEWPGVPFATNCDDEPDYGRCIQDMPREFYGGIENDKVGGLGTGYFPFFQFTRARKKPDAGGFFAHAPAPHLPIGHTPKQPTPLRPAPPPRPRPPPRRECT